jgi:hypothetical protein
MNDAIKELLSKRNIITDTKLPKAQPTKKQIPIAESLSENSSDPYHNLVRRAIRDKPKKSELLEDFKKIVEMEEQKL